MATVITKNDLIMVGEEVSQGWGAYLTSFKIIDKNTIRFNAIEYDEEFYFDMSLIEIKEELDKINDRNKKVEEQLKRIRQH